MTVPWFIGYEGALHPAAVARQFANLATSGSEGVAGPSDWKITALDLPGPFVRANPGGGVLLNRSPGGDGQSYIDRTSILDDSIEIPENASSQSPRTDIVIRRIEDPEYPGWQAPASAANGPYGFFRVLTNQDPAVTKIEDLNLSYPAIALSKVTVPPSTSAISNAMLTDLRRLAVPRTKREIRRIVVAPNQNVTSTGFVNWPAEEIQVPVPIWANSCSIRAELLVGHFSPETRGQIRALIGGKVITTVDYNFDLATGSQRVPLLVTGTTSIETSGGMTRPLKLQATRTTGYTGFLTTVTNSYFVFDVQFDETVV